MTASTSAREGTMAPNPPRPSPARRRRDPARIARRALWSSPYSRPWQGVAAQWATYDRAVVIVRAYYACALFLTILSMAEWPALVEVEAIASPWPSAWIPEGAVPDVIPYILSGYLGASILAAALPQWRVARLLYFILLVQYVSLISGFGGVSHNNHVWLWISGVLVLLPNGRWSARRRRAEDRHHFISVIWIAQILMMFFYALTGFWKIVFAVHGAVTERASSLALDGFSQIVAFQEMRVAQDPVLADFFVRNHVAGWALFAGTIYVEVAALNVAFRPRLHRTWGILLIGFHVGTELAMGFTFLPNALAASLLLVCSPLMPDTVSARDALLDLPGVRLLHRRWNGALRRTSPSAGSTRPRSLRRDSLDSPAVPGAGLGDAVAPTGGDVVGPTVVDPS